MNQRDTDPMGDGAEEGAQPVGSWRSPTRTRIVSALFLAACMFVVDVSIMAVQGASGSARLLLTVATLFPVLMAVTAGLRLAAMVTRRVILTDQHLIHRQIFKNYRVPLDDILKLEVRYRQDGSVDTVRIHWTGQAFYIDETALEGYEDFFAALKASINAPVIQVETFDPVG